MHFIISLVGDKVISCISYLYGNETTPPIIAFKKVSKLRNLLIFLEIVSIYLLLQAFKLQTSLKRSFQIFFDKL